MNHAFAHAREAVPCTHGTTIEMSDGSDQVLQLQTPDDVAATLAAMITANSDVAPDENKTRVMMKIMMMLNGRMCGMEQSMSALQEGHNRVSGMVEALPREPIPQK